MALLRQTTKCWADRVKRKPKATEVSADFLFPRRGWRWVNQGEDRWSNVGSDAHIGKGGDVILGSLFSLYTLFISFTIEIWRLKIIIIIIFCKGLNLTSVCCNDSLALFILFYLIGFLFFICGWNNF